LVSWYFFSYGWSVGKLVSWSVGDFYKWLVSWYFLAMVGQLVSWSVGSWSVGVGQLVGWSVLMVSLVNCVVRFVFSVKFLIT